VDENKITVHDGVKVTSNVKL